MANETWEQIQGRKARERDKLWNATGVIQRIAKRGLRKAIMPEQALSEILQVAERHLYSEILEEPKQ